MPDSFGTFLETLRDLQALRENARAEAPVTDGKLTAIDYGAYGFPGRIHKEESLSAAKENCTGHGLAVKVEGAPLRYFLRFAPLGFKELSACAFRAWREDLAADLHEQVYEIRHLTRRTHQRRKARAG